MVGGNSSEVTLSAAARQQRFPRRPRQADIAELAGVSQATVSLILNGRDAGWQIALETRVRVLQAAKQLGYVADPAARKLAGGSNQLLGLYTFEPVFPVNHRDFYYPFLRGVEEEAANSGFDLLLFTSAGPDGSREIYRDGVNRLLLADGCVLLGRHAPMGELTKLVMANFPFVFIGRRDIPGGGLTYVTSDYASATAEIVEHLAELGHRKVLYLGEAKTREPSVDRQRGFELGVERLQLDPALTAIYRGGADSITPQQLRTWLADGVTAFCCEVFLADAFDGAAKALGAAAPKDFSLAVLGDRPGYTSAEDDWTRFSIPRREVGDAAVRLLLELLDTGPTRLEAREVLLPCRFVDGKTTGPPP